MVRIRSKATSPGHQESRNAFSNPYRDRLSTPIMQLPSIQHVQSMVAAMAKLTSQKQELTREISLRRQRHEKCTEGQAHSKKDRGNVEPENQSRGTASLRVPHLEKENIRMVNPINDLVHWTDSPFTTSINSHPLPSKFKMPSLDSYEVTRDPFDHIATFKTTMHL